MATRTIPISDVIDEAVEQAGLHPNALTVEHIESIRRSMFLLNVELEQDGASAEYREHRTWIKVPKGTGAIPLPEDTLGVLSLQVESPDKSGEITLARISRSIWDELSDKYSLGFPNNWWMSKSLPQDGVIRQNLEANYALQTWGDDYGWSRGPYSGAPVAGDPARAPLTNGTPCLVVWPIVDQETIFWITRYRMHADVDAPLGDQADYLRNWLPTVVSGLASKLAQKWNPERYAMLKAEYETKLLQRHAEDDDDPIIMGARAFGRTRRRRI